MQTHPHSPPLRRTLASLVALLVCASLTAPGASADPTPYGWDDATGNPSDDSPPPAATPDELDELVAPIALYPDVILDALLPASTAPSDLAAASAYVAANGGAVNAAPADVAWDPSVVALLQFPDVLRWMDANPVWTERLAIALTFQQADVLAAVQRYRERARALGVLTTDEHQVVTVAPDRIIVIEPVSPEIVYVPVYDPWVLGPTYVYAPSRPFYQSWFGFSFGIGGLWLRHRIQWGSGIYAYGSPYYYGRSRSRSSDWGYSRPTYWSARHRSYARSGRTYEARDRRPSSPSYARAGTTTRITSVAPPRRRTTVTPGAPVVRDRRWDRDPRSGTTASPRGGPRAGSRPIERVSPPAPIPPTSGTTSPRVIPSEPTRRSVPTDRGTIRRWRSRGRSSLESLGTSVATRAVAPRASIPTVTPNPVPRVAVPRAQPTARPAPRPRPTQIPDGARVRRFLDRGRHSLKGS